ncbi:MAG: hypothetical protein LBM39_00140 [Candidatus Methanoplasma sp.]|jgi:hypothetical protein|nr:hypothetical protein [Candidatus Methanoplasma sp.]
MNKPKLAASLIYCSAVIVFIIFLATAFAPVVTGGLELNDSDFTYETSGLDITVKGSVELESDLPYDITNVKAGLYLRAGDVHTTVFDTGSVNVSKGGKTVIQLDGKVSVINALLYSAYSYSPGDNDIRIPMNLSIQAYYPLSLFGAEISGDTDLVISNSGSAKITAATDSHIAVEVSWNDSGSISAFTGKVDGTGIDLKLTKTSNVLTFDIDSTEKIVKALEKVFSENGELKFTTSAGNITLNEQESRGLIDVLRLILEEA